MEGMGMETLSFPLLKSGKRQKVHLGRNVSNHFVADWRSFIGGSKGGARGVRPPSVIFRANWGSKGRKIIIYFLRPGPPLIWRSGSASEFPSCWRQTVDARIWLSWDYNFNYDDQNLQTAFSINEWNIYYVGIHKGERQRLSLSRALPT